MKAHKEQEHSLDERDEELEAPAYMDGEDPAKRAPIIPGKGN